MDSRIPERWLHDTSLRSAAAPGVDPAEVAGPLPAVPAFDATWLSNLVRTIESEVIPRLMLAHRAAADEANAPPEPLLTEAHVAEFAVLAMRHDHEVARAYVEALRTQGVSLEIVYLDLLAPAARRLGDLWCEDECDFAMVTIGLACLQNVMHGLGPEFCAEGAPAGSRGKVVLCAALAEQHTFGLHMVGDFLRRDGWQVAEEVQTGALLRRVRTEWIDVVGLTLARSTGVDRLSATIRRVRRESRNNDTRVVVGGRLFIEQPSLVGIVGADAMANDGRHAVQQVRALGTLLCRRA